MINSFNIYPTGLDLTVQLFFLKIFLLDFSAYYVVIVEVTRKVIDQEKD